MIPEHFSDHDLERYYLGMITDAVELANLEEHLLTCAECVARAKEAQNYVDAIRRGIIEGNLDRDPADHDLERYYLGMITDAVELANLEEHLLTCAECVARAKEAQNYVDAIRRGIIEGNLDRDPPEE